MRRAVEEQVSVTTANAQWIIKAVRSAVRHALIVVCVVLALDAAAAAQQQASTPLSTGPRVAAGVGILGAVSVGEFAEQVEEAGGILGHLDVRLGRGPFRVGAEVSYLEYGHTDREVSLRTLVPDIPDASLHIDTTNALFLMHARLRAQRMQGRWRPYGDALVGFADLFTRTGIRGGVSCSPGFLGGGSVCTYANAGSTTNARDVVLTFGGAGGVTYSFSSRWPRLDLSWRYVRGGSARYLTENAFRIEQGQTMYDFRESRTDHVGLYIGLAWPR
jgi:hypothetical protein